MCCQPNSSVLHIQRALVYGELECPNQNTPGTCGKDSQEALKVPGFAAGERVRKVSLENN